jgi:hypothetical protein
MTLTGRIPDRDFGPLARASSQCDPGTTMPRPWAVAIAIAITLAMTGLVVVDAMGVRTEHGLLTCVIGVEC